MDSQPTETLRNKISGQIWTVWVQSVSLVYSGILLQRLLTNGVVFESMPTSLSLPPESGPHRVVLSGTPKEIGELEVLGKLKYDVLFKIQIPSSFFRKISYVMGTLLSVWQKYELVVGVYS